MVIRITVTGTLVALLTVCTARPAWAAEGAEGQGAEPDAAAVEFFEKKVRPVLAANCYKCHSESAEKVKAKLYVDSRDGLVKGGSSGPAIVVGNPAKSALIQAIRQVDPDTAMPPKGKLSDQEIADLTQWVKMGAPWPQSPAGGAVKADAGEEYEKARKEHWAWQPLRKVEPPRVSDAALASWAKSDIDRFIAGQLELNGLKPSPTADKVTLLRRVTFDLTGLPPSGSDVEAFLKDTSPQALEKVVDRLLASPAFGERWGRHWLDVARYAESTGMSRNVPYPYAWRYRNYVIDSFNADKPYDQFIREQIAGDLLAKDAPEKKRQELLVATGFLAVGPKDVNEREPVYRMNVVDEQIDTSTKAILGLTVACARCHDHKFDPIPTREYYSMAGIFLSTEMMAGVGGRRGGGRDYYKPELLLKLEEGYTPKYDVPDLSDPDKRRKFLAEQGRQKVEVEPLAMGVRDSSRPTDARVLIRGELDQRGDTVKRGVVSICGDESPSISSRQSGRLELAQWMASPSNPLTSRVMVNRIWQHLFGTAIVRSVDNFGTTGEKPSHPDLLDHLASRFVADGWSVKKTIKSIVLSSAYQQASAFDAAKYAKDPENRLVWRMNQRRLEGEAIRDAMLAASGTLDLKRPETSTVMALPAVELGRRGRFGEVSEGNYRSVYLPIIRNAEPEFLDLFDLADTSMVSGQRDVTTVAPQALFMMNDPFVFEQAKKLATSLLEDEKLSDEQRVEKAYKLALSRPPTGADRMRAMSYLRAFASDPAAPTPQPAIRRFGRQQRQQQSNASERTERDAWTGFCQALFASAEFRYLN